VQVHRVQAGETPGQPLPVVSTIIIIIIIIIIISPLDAWSSRVMVTGLCEAVKVK